MVTTGATYTLSLTELMSASDIGVDYIPRKPQKKNPMLKVGPLPIVGHKSKPIRKKESFKRASPKVITRVW